MRGCWTPPINSPHGWPAMGIPFHIEENETTFTIDWKGRYRIEGAAFVYMDRETGRLATIHGYPTHKLIQMR